MEYYTELPQGQGRGGGCSQEGLFEPCLVWPGFIWKGQRGFVEGRAELCRVRPQHGLAVRPGVSAVHRRLGRLRWPTAHKELERGEGC